MLRRCGPALEEVGQFGIHTLGLFFLRQVATLRNRHCTKVTRHTGQDRGHVEHLANTVKVGTPWRGSGLTFGLELFLSTFTKKAINRLFAKLVSECQT